MTNKTNFKTILLSGVMVATLLTACESIGWLGEDNEVPLEGERIALFENPESLTSEPAAIDVRANLRDPLPMRDVTPEEAAAIAKTEAALREMEEELLENEKTQETDVEIAQENATSQAQDPVVPSETEAKTQAQKMPNTVKAQNAMREAQVNVVDASVLSGFIKPPVWPNEFWPQAGGYGKHSMQHVAFRETGLPERIWDESIGRGASKDLPLTASPIVVDGIVFTMDSRATIRATEAESGDELWDMNAGKDNEDAVIGGGLAFSGGQLFATNGFNEVMAIDPYTGQINWRAEISGPARAAPSAVMGTPGKVFATTLDNSLIALNATNGDVLWTHRGLKSNASLLGSASPAVSRDIVVPAYSSGEIYALNPENGGVAWTNNLANAQRQDNRIGLTDIRALPVIDKGMIIGMSFANKLVAIDERSGERVWEQPIGGSQTPWVSGNRIFVLDNNMRLYGLERETGDVVWVTNLPAYENMKRETGDMNWYGPIFAGHRLMLFADNGDAVIVNPVDGKVLQNWETGIEVTQPPVIAAGRLYLLDRDGTLAAFQ